jgi:hypothetical protein
MKTYGGVEVQLHEFLTPVLGGGEWSASCPNQFACGVKVPYTHWIGGWVLFISVKPYVIIFTYSMVQDILWEAGSHSVCQTVACFLHGTWNFITVLTGAHHRSLSWANWIQFAPLIPVSLKSILLQLLRLCQRISPGPRYFEIFC